MDQNGYKGHIAELQAVMALLEDRLEADLEDLPARRRTFVPNALLNLAVERLLAEEGHARTASLLIRLADHIASGHLPARNEAFPLDGMDA